MKKVKEISNKIIAFIVLESFIFSMNPRIVYSEPEEKKIVIVNETEVEVETGTKEKKVFHYTATVTPELGGTLQYEGVSISIPPGAVEADMEITIEKLSSVAVLPATLENVTAGCHGYRFLPDGMIFRKEVEVSIPFSEEVLSSEAALANLFTYFYDDEAKRWERLKRLAVDTIHMKVTSETSHFTDMVNTTLKLPELLQPINFNLNSIKELKAANPVEGIPEMHGLEANNTGSASFQIPLRVPAGRGKATPKLAITYNSDAQGGWLGRGFDIPLQNITVDTRFGLPDYDENDVFLIGGQQLVLHEERYGESRYRLRKEGTFQQIRHIKQTGTNYWEVTEKDGSVTWYGLDEAWIGPERTDRSRTYTWYMSRFQDSNGNRIDYEYEYVALDQAVSLTRIVYSGFADEEEGKYTIGFESEARQDRRMDCRGRFLSRMSHRLKRIVIACDGTPVRAYGFEYGENIFGQSQLLSYTEEDGNGKPFYTYAFDYYGLPEKLDNNGELLGYKAFREEKRWGAGDSYNAKGLDEKVSVSLGGSLYAGVHLYVPKFWGRKTIASFGIRGGINFGLNFSKSTMLDINGDGLPDMAWKDGPVLYSYLNRYNEETDEQYFDIWNPYTVSGVSGLLNKGTQTSFSLGLSATLLGASGAVSKQYCWAESESSFADVNGDGYIDIVDKGSQYWKRNTGSGSFMDTHWVFGDEESPDNGGIDAVQQERFNRTFYLQEPLKRWNAYVPGIVNIENDVQLLDSYGASSDGVEANTWFNDTKRTIRLDRGNGRGSDSFRHEAAEGDKIYFHLSTGNDERGDAVAWDTKIRYEQVAFFYGLNDVAVLTPPVRTQEASLPGNDNRFSPLYTLDGNNSYRLKDNWENLCTAEVYDALLEYGYFVPKKITLPTFIKLFDRASLIKTPEAAYSDRSLLLLAYDYIPEKKIFVRKNGMADGVVRKHAAAVWTEDEKREMVFYRWLDGSDIRPSSGGTESVYNQGRVTGNPPYIYDVQDIYRQGAFVIGKGYFLDYVYDEGDGDSPLYMLWLRQENNGIWHVYRDDGETIVLENGVVTAHGDRVEINTGGIIRTYRFSGRSSIVEQVPSWLYERCADEQLMWGEVFSALAIEEIPRPVYETVLTGLSETEKAFVNGCFEPDVSRELYVLKHDTAIDDYTGLLAIFDNATQIEGSVFNGCGNEKRLILLDEGEYSDFISVFPSAQGYFSSFTDIETNGKRYYWNRTVVGSQKENVTRDMYMYRRDFELFPFYREEGDRRILLQTADMGEVNDFWNNAGYHVWNNLTAGISYHSNTLLLVEDIQFPAGGTVSAFSPYAEAPLLPGDEAGKVNILYLDSGGRTVTGERYIPISMSGKDYSSEDMVVYPDRIFSMNEVQNEDQGLIDGLTFDNFSGGIGGWFYHLWCGYHTFDEKLIGSYPDQDQDTDVVVPSYTLNVVENKDEQGQRRIIMSGRNPAVEVQENTWIGEISSYSEPELDDAGNNTCTEYTFAPFIEGNMMYPGRKGGDAYYRVPSATGVASGGALSAIRKSKSNATDINGGISIGILGANFSMNDGASNQYTNFMDVNGDRYPDILMTGQDGGNNARFVPGTNGGFGESRQVRLEYENLNRYENLAFGFGASAGSGASGISFAMNDRAKVYQTVIQHVEDTDGGISGGLNGTVGQGVQTTGFADFNGDGLPDHVRRNGGGSYSVQLNTGMEDGWIPVSWNNGMNTDLGGWEFSVGSSRISCEAQGLEYSNTGSFGGNVGLGIGPVGVSGGFTGNVNKTVFRLADVNGDGLPDQVAKHPSEPYFRVRFNTGDTFTDDEIRLYRPDWDIDMESVLSSAINHDLGIIARQLGGVSLTGIGLDIPGFQGFPSSGNQFGRAINPVTVDDTLDYSSGLSFNLGASLTLSWDWFLIALVITPGVNGSYATTSATLRFGDINGDGLPDHVLKLPGEEFVRVKENTLGIAGLLKNIQLPAGGRIEAGYRRVGNTKDMPQSRYVLSSITRHDGIIGGGQDESVHTYRTEYEYEAGYYDREERDFYGFSIVTTIYGDGSFREVRYDNSDYTRKGLVLSERLYDGNRKLYAETIRGYTTRTYSGIDGHESVFHALSSTTSRIYSQADNSYAETRQLFGYDPYGNISRMEDEGDVTTENDDYELFIRYASLDGYRYGYPGLMEVYDGERKLIRRREGTYDGKGNLTGLKHYRTATTCSSYAYSYDKYGNPVSVTRPRGYTLDYSYDPLLNKFPVRIEAYNRGDPGYRYVSSIEWDYVLGVITARVDQNNNREERLYDTFGRLLSLRSPYDTGEVPAVTYAYHTESDLFPWYAVTGNKVRIDSTDRQVLRTLTFADGLGRTLYTAKEGETGYGSSRTKGWNCSGVVAYDGKGRAVRQGQSVFSEGEEYPGWPQVVLPVISTYDALDRVTCEEFPDGSTFIIEHLVEGNSRLIKRTDPLGNISEEMRGMRDEILEMRRRDNEKRILTSATYRYNPLGEIIEIRDHEENPTVINYDMTGNRLSIRNEDTGLTEYFYDEAGNMVKKIDAVMRKRGEAITCQYDGFNRLILTDYPRMTDVRYEYGTPGTAHNGAGRLLRRIDESGTVSFSYGMLGEVVEKSQSLKRLTPMAGNKSIRFTYLSDYLGQMERIGYPDGETVLYDYDSGGQVKSVSSVHKGLRTDYVKEIGYDEYGQRIYIRLGDDTETSYTYDPERRWLKNIHTENHTGTVYQDIDYRFDPVGNVLSYVNNAGRYETSQQYGYDGLYQLASAEGTYRSRPYGVTDYTSTYCQAFVYDSIGNMRQKRSEGENTPAVLRGQVLNYQFDYAYYNDRPHQPERIGNLWYLYDENGNMTEEREGGHSSPVERTDDAYIRQEENLFFLDYGFGLIRHEEETEKRYMRRYVWDEENRLKRSVDDNNTTDYLYDANGVRTIKRSAHNETLYFDSMWSTTTDYNDFRQSKHIYIGQTRIATRLNIEGDGSTGYEEVNTFYYHTDHLGSAQLVTDYSGNVYEHIEYTPYGELWIEEKSDSFDKIPFRFTGKEFDEETGNYYYGARYLDPRTSRWISADPALGDYLPVVPDSDKARNHNQNLPGLGGVFNIVNIALYHYAGNNPVKYTDPTGKDTFHCDKWWGSKVHGVVGPYIEDLLYKQGYTWVQTNRWMKDPNNDDMNISRRRPDWEAWKPGGIINIWELKQYTWDAAIPAAIALGQVDEYIKINRQHGIQSKRGSTLILYATIPFPELGPSAYIEIYQCGGQNYGQGTLIFYRVDDGIKRRDPIPELDPDALKIITILAFLAALAAWLGSGGQAPVPQPAQ
jgi:RHS repeat-associated protein